MYTSILLAIINIIVLYRIKNIKNDLNEYTKDKVKYLKLRLKYINRVVNVGFIIINFLYYIIIALYVGLNKIDNLYIYLITYGIYIASYILFELNTQKLNKKHKLIDKKYYNDKEYLLTFAFYVLFIIEKTTIKYNLQGLSNLDKYNYNKNYNIFLKILCIIIIFISFKWILNIIIKYKNLVTYTYDDSLYYDDIKFYGRIDLKKGFNHLIFISSYIIFFYINIPFIYIFYVVLAIFILYYIINKVKKITYESDRVYKSITIAKKNPGLLYAFQFTKDLLFLKKLVYFFVMLVFSILLYYGLGESVFSYTIISVYMLFFYLIIEDKVYLIRYLFSLNESIIDDNIYKINENKKINYIDNINIFGIKLYKLIVEDTIIYESNLILYDPEYRIDDINIRINKSNIDDYITIEEKLYEE